MITGRAEGGAKKKKKRDTIGLLWPFQGRGEIREAGFRPGPAGRCELSPFYHRPVLSINKERKHRQFHRVVQPESHSLSSLTIMIAVVAGGSTAARPLNEVRWADGLQHFTDIAAPC